MVAYPSDGLVCMLYHSPLRVLVVCWTSMFIVKYETGRGDAVEHITMVESGDYNLLHI